MKYSVAGGPNTLYCIQVVDNEPSLIEKGMQYWSTLPYIQYKLKSISCHNLIKVLEIGENVFFTSEWY